jgi:hypothetical protein
MHGTFYVNSGQIGYPAYMTVDQLKGLAAKGHEIGGHTIDHPDLTKLQYQDKRDEVCNDRTTLMRLGFKVTDFAFPYGAGDQATKQVVKACGYTSARRTSGLKSTAIGCEGCPVANPIPPETDYWSIRTGTNDAHLAELKAQVTTAERAGGGWVPMVFHHTSDDPKFGKDKTSLTDFKALVDWLDDEPGVKVYTIDQMIGGANKPAVGQVISRWSSYGAPAPAPVDQGATNPATGSHAAAFTFLGIRVSQGFVISTALVIGIVGVLAYRFGARGNRYKSAGH